LRWFCAPGEDHPPPDASEAFFLHARITGITSDLTKQDKPCPKIVLFYREQSPSTIMLKKKKFLLILLLIPCALVLTIYWCNRAIAHAADNKLYSDTRTIPFNKVGLLLGTSKLVNGHDNPFYVYRIRAAADLLKAHKIKYLIISGDNGRSNYNEPASMRADLVAAGIDSSLIYLDYAGFRTFDSVVRLKQVFGQDSVTIISQQFHNERAIYIAQKEGMTAIGFNAADVSARQGSKTLLREKLARVKVFLDVWFGTKPKFLGNKIAIPA
jgi:SanA protein